MNPVPDSHSSSASATRTSWDRRSVASGVAHGIHGRRCSRLARTATAIAPASSACTRRSTSGPAATCSGGQIGWLGRDAEENGLWAAAGMVLVKQPSRGALSRTGRGAGKRLWRAARDGRGRVVPDDHAGVRIAFRSKSVKIGTDLRERYLLFGEIAG